MTMMHAALANTIRHVAATLMLFIIALSTLKPAHAQIITTVAGNGTRAITSFGGQATTTTTGRGDMQGLVVDTLGNFYFTDGITAEIRKVDTSGVISVFAGSAQGLVRPWGLGIDAANNVYAADIDGNRVWKITPAGVATSVAGAAVGAPTTMGGQATATFLGGPYAVAVDTLGNIYILEDGLLKVTTATGIITNFRAGCGSDTAITTDAANNVYRVCNQFNRVEKIAPGGGVPTRIAGLASGAGTSDTGDNGLGVNASLYYPLGVAVDSFGNVFISTNGRIRKLDTAGIITTLGGTTPGFAGDGALAPLAQLYQGGQVAVDTAGNVYFLDQYSNRVRKITLTVPPAPTIASVEGMNGQLAVRLAAPVYDGGRPITSYAATCGAQSATSAVAPIIVSGLTNGTTISCTVRATNSLGQGPVSASVSGTPFQPQIHTIAGTGTAGYSGDGGQGNVAQVSQATGVVADAAGNLYVADIGNNRIRKISPSGVITTIAGTSTAGFTGDGGQATSAQLNQPHNVALDAAGNIYIASYADHRIRKVSTTGVISTIAGTGTAGSAGDGGQATSAQLNLPVSVTLDPAGNLYISERGNHKIRRIDTSGVITTYAGTGTATYSGDGGQAASAGINYPGAVRFDSGFLYIADFGNHRVRRVNSAGVITTYAGTGVLGFSGDGGQATSAQFHAPYGLSFHPNGDLYVGTGGDYRIRKITPAGIVTTVAGNGTNMGGANGSVALAGGVTPNMDVLVDGLGNLYFASYIDNVVRKITLVPPALPTSVLATPGLSSLSVSFTPAPTNGGIATNSYTVTCGSQSNTGTTSPIVVSGLAAGIAVTCTVRAVSVAGAGQPSVASASTAPLLTQIITFTSLPAVVNRIVGGADIIAATGGASGNAVVFTSATTSVCTAGGTNGETLSFIGVGTCTINANQAGNATYAAAPQAATTFSIAQAAQTITLVSSPSGASLVFGGSGTFVATGAASGNSVVFTSQTTAVCTTSGSNGATVNFVGVGNCTVNMNQAGNANYAASPTLSATLTIANANQTITYGVLPTLKVGISYTAAATATSGAAVTFTSLTPTICTATGTNGTTITANQLGVCTIAADQVGTANYDLAPQVTRALAVYLAEQWVTAASLQTGRVWHTATKLQDGRVLVVGGFNGAYLASAEIFDPLANTWTAVGNLANARRAHTATLLNNGKVLIVGGQAGPFAILGAAELFDPATNAFSSAGSAVQRASHQAVLLSDGCAMVIGGEANNTADIYDPATNTWTAAANMPTQRQSFIVSRLANGNVLVAGGLISGATATAIIYNPTTNVWSSAATASVAAARLSATGTTLQSGLVMMAGGQSSSGPSASFENYDSVANTWSAVASMTGARRNHAAALLVNGSVLAVGGDNTIGTISTNDLYNPISNTWSLTANLNTARSLHTATTLNDGSVLAASGATVGTTTTNTAEIYLPLRFGVLPANQTLPAAAVGTAYGTATFTGVGGLAPYTYAISSGVLPAGISLSSAGLLSGTPTAAGMFAIMLVVTDANGFNAIRAYSLTVSAATQAITFGSAPTINLQTSAVLTVTATGGASGNPVVFSVLSGNCVSTGPNGSSISGIDQGTCVIAANQAGNAGYSAAPQVTQNVEVVSIPGIPSMVVATRGNGQVGVSFTPPTRTGNSPITSYIATCGSQSVSGSGSPIVVTPLTNGVQVTCTVRAVNAIGTGPASSASNAIAPATVPDAPIIGTATAGAASVSVAFSSPAFNGGVAIVSYTATCGVASANGAMSPITVTGLANGVAVTCVVSATNSIGAGNQSSASNSAIPVDVPNAPTGVAATASNGSISVVFTAPQDNGSAITSYTATCGTVSASGAASPIVVTGVTNGVALSCTVVATNAVGNSTPSAPSNAVVGVGSWRAAGSMANARATHTVTLLADGRVLVAGGSDSFGAYPAAAEIYAPATNSWLTTGSLNTPRGEHTATLMNDGRVLIAGGRSSTGVVQSSTEIFDPATSLWTVGPAMRFARVGHNATLLNNGRVLIAGLYNVADLYNPATNTMSAGGSDPVARFEALLVTMADGRVLMAGGSMGATVWSSASLYDPATNTWAAASNMGVARRIASAVRLSNGSAFVVAGAASAGGTTQIAQTNIYNISTNLWTPAANVPVPVNSEATLSVVPNGSVLRVGGRDGSTFMNITLAYDASTNAWAQSSNLITARNQHGAVVFSNGQILVVGGSNNAGTLASAEIRDADGATAPSAPTIGTATAGNATVSVTFTSTSYANSGGSGITGYVATCGVQSNTSTTSPIVVSGLANGVAVTCTVTATNALGTSAASATSNAVTPSLLSQTIIFDANPGPLTYAPSASFIVGATGGASGNAVVFSSNTHGTCTVSGTNGATVTIVTAGTCTIAADQTSNGSYAVAITVTQDVTVNPANQTITFGIAPAISVVSTGSLIATGGASSNPIVFSSQTTSICTVSGTNGSTVTGVVAGTCAIAANQAADANYNAASQATQSFNVTNPAPAGANGTISPSSPQTVTSGAASVYTVTPNVGYTASVGGTCTGTLVGTTYTAAAVTANCTVIASFSQDTALIAVQSRKTHAAAGTFDLLIDASIPINGLITVEPRAIGSGHKIIFQFNQAISTIGAVTATDINSAAIGNANAAISGNEVIVTLTGIAEVSRVTVQLNNVSGVSGLNGPLSLTTSIGFLVGDVNNSRTVNASDISAVKTRSGQTTDASNYKYDLNVSGSINASDIATVKTRSGSGL